jgi:hypothetical protein
MPSVVNKKLHFLVPVLWVSVALTLGACVTPTEPAQPEPAQLPPSPNVQFYPKHGQSQQQQDRDRYECHIWAVKKSGYDPSAEPVQPPAPREGGQPDGSGAVAGAIIGGALGAASSDDDDNRSFNTFLGAATGAMMGAAADANRRRAAEQRAAMQARLDNRVMRYRRAMTACLEGRGYSVR